MPLTLEVVGQKAPQMGGATRKVFQAGGTIGRLRDNDWVLPDDYISGHHAKIIFANGAFLIEDTSTNGVFVNSPQNRLTKGQPYTLRHGDTVYIDDYEVRVSLSAEPAAAAPSARRPALIPEDPFFQPAAGTVGALEETDPLKLLGIQDARAVPPGPSAASLANNSPLSQHYRPPESQPVPPPRPAPRPAPPRQAAPPASPPPPSQPPAAGGFIPDDYDPLASDDAPPPPRRSAPPPPPPPAPPPPRPAPEQRAAAGPRPAVSPPTIPTPGARSGAQPPAYSAPPVSPYAGSQPARRQVPPAPAAAPAAQSTASTAERRALGSGGDLDFAALLAAAGVDSSQVTPELAQQFGQILRVVVTGVMDVLRARERIKDEFRMRMTTFKAADNNPLKFSANVEDALHNLLVKRNAAYLGRSRHSRTRFKTCAITRSRCSRECASPTMRCSRISSPGASKRSSTASSRRDRS